MTKVETVEAVDAERPKDFLTDAEVERLLLATSRGRYPKRDRAMVLVLYRHGLRVSELCQLRMSDLDLTTARLYVRRLKGGLSTWHPIAGDVLRALRAWLAERKRRGHEALPWVFVSERGTRLTRQTIAYLIAQAAEAAGLAGVHPHTLRHACGYALINRGVAQRVVQDYLGHRDPTMTAHYARISPRRFEEIWD